MAWQYQALLRHGHVYYALAYIVGPEEGQKPEIGLIFFQGRELGLGYRVPEGPGSIVRRDGMIYHPANKIRAPQFAAGGSKPLESLVRGDLVNKMPIYIY
jgi:hypothetical protein